MTGSSPYPSPSPSPSSSQGQGQGQGQGPTPGPDESLLVASDLSRRYAQPGGREVVGLTGVSLEVGAGELFVVTGESGSGKSTLLGILGLLDRSTSGSLRFRGEALERASLSRLARVRRASFGFVFQDFRLVPHLDALGNVRLPLDLAATREPVADPRRRALEHLERLGLADRAGHLPRDLSRGEMQRVAMARALATEPEVLVADEPTANLDRANADAVWAILEEAARERGVAVVVATHDRDRASRAARSIELRDGAPVAPPGLSGPAASSGSSGRS